MAGTLSGYVKIPDAEGESTSDSYAKQIEALSVIFGAQQKQAETASSGGSLTTGLVQLKAVGFVKVIDKSTPNLYKLCAQSKTLDEIDMTLVRTVEEETEYFSLKLEKAVIASVLTVTHDGEIPCFGGNTGLPELKVQSDLPIEAVCIWPSKITWKYTETIGGKKGGTVEANYDRSTNKTG